MSESIQILFNFIFACIAGYFVFNTVRHRFGVELSALTLKIEKYLTSNILLLGVLGTYIGLAQGLDINQNMDGMMAAIGLGLFSTISAIITFFFSNFIVGLRSVVRANFVEGIKSEK